MSKQFSMNEWFIMERVVNGQNAYNPRYNRISLYTNTLYSRVFRNLRNVVTLVYGAQWGGLFILTMLTKSQWI